MAVLIRPVRPGKGRLGLWIPRPIGRAGAYANPSNNAAARYSTSSSAFVLFQAKPARSEFGVTPPDELRHVHTEHVIYVEKQRLIRTHFESFRRVSS